MDKREQYQDNPILEVQHEQWKKDNAFDKGMAIIVGKVWHNIGKKGLYLNFVDTDNQKGIDKFCTRNGKTIPLEQISQKIIVEQHKDDLTKAHFYFYSHNPLNKKSSDRSTTNEIPAIEVKGKGSHGIAYCTPSLHKNGSNYEIIGTKEPEIFDDMQEHLNSIFAKYNLNCDNTLLPIEELFKKGTIIYEGQNRHEALLRIMESLLRRNRDILTEEQIIKLAHDWNHQACRPPLEPREFQRQWKYALSYIDRKDKEEYNNNNNNNNNNENNTSDKSLSVLEAKRLQGGHITVMGTIVSVSDMYILEKQNNEKGITEYRNAKSIQLEDSEKLDENERLDVVLYDNMIDNVVAGETVQISGNIRIEDKKNNGKSKKKYNVLHADSIQYLNRKEILVTDTDIKSFEKFIEFPQLLDRLTAMLAPDIIGHDDVKRGLLRSIVGGVDRGKKGDGRISTLEVGDPGTAKSRLGAEASEIKPNSRHVSAPHATTKTITAIVEKVNDSVSLMLGAIPLSKNAICAIDEINSFPIEDQSRLLDVLEEGKINLDKLGRRYTILAPTTIIATANPISGKWNNEQVATIEEIELKKSLMDRFTQIYTFRDNMDENQTNDFVTEMSAIRKRNPHNYNFLAKYLIHASSIKEVKFTKNAENRLNQFWVKAKVKGLLSIRMYKGLYKIAEAQAKLQLKKIVDDEIIDQVIQDVQLMMIQYGETVEQFIGPHELTLNTFLEILKKNHPTAMTLESICEFAIKENDRIGSYLGYIWTLRDNWKLRSVVDSVLNHRNMIRIQEKPIVIKFLCDGCDACEGKTENKSNETDKNVSSDILETCDNECETVSHTSHTSLREKD